MTARQEGVDEIRVRSTFAGIEPALTRDITAAAFEVPRMRAAEDGAFTTQAFSETYELACYRALAENQAAWKPAQMLLSLVVVPAPNEPRLLGPFGYGPWARA